MVVRTFHKLLKLIKPDGEKENSNIVVDNELGLSNV